MLLSMRGKAIRGAATDPKARASHQQIRPSGIRDISAFAQSVDRSSDLQARAFYTLLRPPLPSRMGPVLPMAISFLLTAAGQSWILTRFPISSPRTGKHQQQTQDTVASLLMSTRNCGVVYSEGHAQRTRGRHQMLKGGRYFLPRTSLKTAIGVAPETIGWYYVKRLFEKLQHLV